MEYSIYYDRDVLNDGTPCIVAKHLELPGCYGFGADEDEARNRLALAREAYLSSLAEDGIPAPDPIARIVTVEGEPPEAIVHVEWSLENEPQSVTC